MQELAAALEGSALGTWARGSAYAYPVANLLHLLGLVMLVGGIGTVDLRLTGLFRSLPIVPLSQALIPVAAAGVVLLVASGAVLFAADAVPLLGSATFRWKLAFIVLALSNLVLFHAFWQRRLADWNFRIPPLARAMAAVSLLSWLTVATLGRLIAYT